MKARNDYSHLAPEIAEALREMDRAHEEASEGSVPVKGDWEFLQMVLNARIVEQAERAMKESGMSRADLARRMDVSRARVTTLLNEEGNFQLETIAKLAVALDRDVAVRLVKKDEKVRVEPAKKPLLPDGWKPAGGSFRVIEMKELAA